MDVQPTKNVSIGIDPYPAIFIDTNGDPILSRLPLRGLKKVLPNQDFFRVVTQ
jgi:hypothetical protein